MIYSPDFTERDTAIEMNNDTINDKVIATEFG